MSVTISVVQTKSQLKDFILLPEKIHRNDARWLPPMYADEWKFYNPKYNNSFARCETVLLLAYKDAKPTGRVMGIIDPVYNAGTNERTARFFNLECYDDQETLNALMNSVEKWSLSKGMDTIIGPFGFSDKDPQGLQIEGFEHIPVIATAGNFPYLKDRIEGEGYQKKFDCLVYKLDIPATVPEQYVRVAERILHSRKVRLVEFTNRRQLKPYIVPVLRLVNETYRSIYGFVEMDEEEMKQLAAKYLPILDPVFTKVITDSQNNPMAFIVASPDMSRGIQRAKGKLFPFGFIHILSDLKKSKQLDLFLGAVKDPDKNKGLIALLGVAIFQSAQLRKMEFIDSHLILETNKAMRAVMERLGAQIYKRYRVYVKRIS
ncbi:MAG: hypothetical protein EYC69_04610 [Bacteroidetes bacterium]|nr:MAG: hypothetical protein EYC69_04610 [Bacteroidota bacterium]